MSGKAMVSSVYFDQNVYDFCADHIPVDQLRRILREKNHNLALGTLDLLELASCFKSSKSKNIERGKFLAQYLESLLPINMLLDISRLLLREAKQALGEPRGSIYEKGDNKKLFGEEIRKLTRGNYDKTASEFIEKDWGGKIAYKEQIEDCLRRSGAINLKAIKAMTFSDFIASHKVKYEAYRKQWVRSELEALVQNLPSNILNSAIKKITKRPDRYPCFAVGSKIYIFIFFKTARDGTVPHDMLTDLKHLISAVHMDIFVSGDHKLIKHAKDICPEKTICSTEEYFQGFMV